MNDSIFSKIIKGEIPCHKVYEDELTFAFLDINPKTAGHTLVVSKKQVASVWDLDSKDYQAVMNSSKKIAKRIQEVLAPKWVGMQVEGVAVPHAHIHVFPFNNIEEYHNVPDSTLAPSAGELAKIAEKLAF